MKESIVMEFNILNSNEKLECGCGSKIGCCDSTLPIAIIGAGPIGLAAAANLKRRNQPFFIIEKGDIAANIQTWSHVKLFSPWRYNVDAAAKALLEETGWQMPNEEEVPTGKQLIEHYLRPLAQLMAGDIYLNSEVVAISKQGKDRMKSEKREAAAYELYMETPNGEKLLFASAVIDATGTWGNPNPALSSGLLLKSERFLRHKIDYEIPNIMKDKERYADKKIAVVGSGHSAINSLLLLVELKKINPQTEIHWILRKKQLADAFGGGSKDELAARGELGQRIQEAVEKGFVKAITPFSIQAIGETEQGIVLQSENDKLVGYHRVIVNTGSRPNFTMNKELRFEVDAITEAVPALAPLIDPNEHSCGTVEAHGEQELRQPDEKFYIVGAKSYGRAPTFLMATGYEQVRSVAAYLAGDLEAAKEVQLNLPETGVCHSGAGGCC